MLVAPSCHNVYLSPKQSQHKSSNAGSSSASKNSGSSASSTSNIFKNFKQKINKSFNFFSNLASSSGSPSTSTSASNSSKPAESDLRESSSSETPSDCSSPDSLKYELGQFKPIIREPRTPSSTTSSKVFRVPTVRSVSTLTDFIIRSPCPSPFIPITPRRASAFSLVRETDLEKPTILAKPEPQKKRKASGPIQPPAKKTRKEVHATPKSPGKTGRGAKKIAAKPKVETKTEVVARKTRSMNLKEAKDVDYPKPAPEKKKVQQQKVFHAPPPPPAKKASPKKRGQVPAASKIAPATRSLRGRH